MVVDCHSYVFVQVRVNTKDHPGDTIHVDSADSGLVLDTDAAHAA